MSTVIAFYVAHSSAILAVVSALLAASESLPFIKGTQAEGVIHGILGLIKRSKDAPAEEVKP